MLHRAVWYRPVFLTTFERKFIAPLEAKAVPLHAMKALGGEEV
jgi:hypothetical protein